MESGVPGLPRQQPRQSTFLDFGEAGMTPKARANLYYYAGLPVCFLGALMLAVGRAASSDIFTGVGATLIVVWVVLVAIGLATSRCPHCRRFIDLRGRSGYSVTVWRVDSRARGRAGPDTKLTE